MSLGPEWLIVIALVILLFGGKAIPKLARGLGQAQKEFKQGLAEGESADTAKESDQASKA